MTQLYISVTCYLYMFMVFPPPSVYTGDNPSLLLQLFLLPLLFQAMVLENQSFYTVRLSQTVNIWALLTPCRLLEFAIAALMKSRHGRMIASPDFSFLGVSCFQHYVTFFLMDNPAGSI